MVYNLTIFKSNITIDSNNGFSFIIFVCFSTKAKHSATSNRITEYITINCINSWNINFILKIPHVTIIYIQHWFWTKTCNCTIFKINFYIILSSTIISIYINYLTRRIKCTLIKSHNRRTICPKCILKRRTIKRCIDKLGWFIPPKICFSINCTIIHNRIIYTNKP